MNMDPTSPTCRPEILQSNIGPRFTTNQSHIVLSAEATTCRRRSSLAFLQLCNITLTVRSPRGPFHIQIFASEGPYGA